MSKGKVYNRRDFLGNAMKTFGAAELAIIGINSGQLVNHASSNILLPSNTKRSFDRLKQINAGVLNIGYAEAGPINAPVIILSQPNIHLLTPYL